MNPLASMFLIVIATAAFGLGSCRAQESSRIRDTAGYEDLRGSGPVAFQGQLWVGQQGIGAVFDPVELDGKTLVEGGFSTSTLGLTWHGEPVAVITNAFEVDCEAQKYRKVSETWLSANAEPLARREATSSEWLDGRHPMARWACGDTSIEPVGPIFSSLAEFVSLYDAEARRLGLQMQVSGPTIARQSD